MKSAISMFAKPVTSFMSAHQSHTTHSAGNKRSARTRLAKSLFFWAMMFAFAIYLETVALAAIFHRNVPSPVPSIPVCVLVAFGVQLVGQMLLSARDHNRQLKAQQIRQR